LYVFFFFFFAIAAEKRTNTDVLFHALNTFFLCLDKYQMIFGFGVMIIKAR